MLDLTVCGADREGVEALTALVELRDPHAFAHGEQVMGVCQEVGRLLGLAEDALAELRVAAQFHDVGKLAIPDWILHKPGPLTEIEWYAMRRHPDLGAALLRSLPGMADVAAAVRFHHERWDGTGYPEGLAEEDIPLASRVLCACDAWDAMTSDRPYRAALPHDVALLELQAGAGRHFDPRVVGALLTVVR
jgi:HD-GYP domain-containing protein (c-di-GMP phosphodiesterase class II)